MPENPYQSPTGPPPRRRPPSVYYHRLALAVAIGSTALMGYVYSLGSPERIWPGIGVTWAHIVVSPLVVLSLSSFVYVLISSLRQ